MDINIYIILACLLILELSYFKIAGKFNIIDKPNLRSSHTRVTLRGGGIIFLLGVWMYIAFYGLSYPYFLCGLTLVSGISFIDDIRSVPNGLRLSVHVVSIFLIFQELGLIKTETWWSLIPALIFCVGVVNAFNFMDGINGMTGAYSLSILFPLCYLNNSIEFIDSHFLIVVMMSVGIFCIFNFRKKARCFAGDVGAVGIAFIILFLVGKLLLFTNNLTYLLLLAVYGVDTACTMIHRIILHEKLGEAHRKHLYQLMANELKLPHVLVSSLYMLLQLSISFGLICFPVNGWIYFFSICAVLVFAYVLFIRKYYHLHREYLEMKL